MHKSRVLMSLFGRFLFSWKMFCRFWDIKQNNFGKKRENARVDVPFLSILVFGKNVLLFLGHQTKYHLVPFFKLGGDLGDGTTIKYIIVIIYNLSSKMSSLYENLCTPAKLYITLALLYMIGAYFSMNGFSNFMKVNQSKVHPSLNSLNFSVNQSKGAITLVNVLFTLFWTWVLNRLCSAGYTKVSWFLVLFPYLFLFIALIFAMWAIFKLHILSIRN